MQIEATDGKVGRLDELVLDKHKGEITHLLMGGSHLWGKKAVGVLASAIDFCDSQVIYLKLDKAAAKICLLCRLNAHRRYNPRVSNSAGYVEF